MRAVDTNILVRLIVRDDPAQVRAAEEFIASGAWVSHLVLAETTWVLDAVYERTAQQIGSA
ncbi:MAG: PIN domain-containing protein [Steroidobacteraceae bacterium]